MNYDKTWIECRGRIKKWHERQEFEERGLGAVFDRECNRLYTRGNYLVICAGKDFMSTAIFYFEAEVDAEDSCDFGFEDCNVFPADCDEGFVFEQITLYRGGRQVATKSGGRSKQVGVSREQLD